MVITITDFLRKMKQETLSGKGIFEPEGKHPNPKWGYWGKWNNWGKAHWQPHALIFGSTLPEPIYYNVVDMMCGTTGLWWDYTKIREGMAASPASRAHGEILGRQSFQRKDAKEMLATVQTMKTVILNLESDLEKIKEQRDAFSNSNVEQIKGLFVDNYGGPSRSWSALAHQVPIVKSALTWFYRLEEKKPEQLKMKKNPGESDSAFNSRWRIECQKDMEAQVDVFVSKEELNPAVGNYMKRKIQEYWTWRNNYGQFINKTYNSIIQNIRQQRANLQLYMKWAKRNIQEAENMFIPFDEVDSIYGMFAEEFPQFAPLFYTVTDMFYDPERKWPIVVDRLRPWVPCMAFQLLMSYNPDVHGNKFVRGFNVMSYGVISTKDKWELIEKLKREKASFMEIMKTYGGLEEDEIRSLGLAETADEKKAQEYDNLIHEKEWLETGLEKGTTPLGGGNLGKQSFGDSDRKRLEEIKQKLHKLGQEIGLDEIDKGKSPSEAKKSIMKEFEAWFNPVVKKDKELYYEAWEWREKFLKGMDPFLKFLGNEVPKTLDTRKRRASWFAYNTFHKVYHGQKAANGWLDYL